MNATDVPLTNGQALFGAVDYTVFLVMLAVSTSIGIYFGCFGNTSDSTDEYLLGGRRMKILPIAISLIASQISGIAIMTVPVEMYGYGTQYWIVVPTIVLVGVLLNYVIVPVFYNNHISNCYQVSNDLKNIITFHSYLFVLHCILGNCFTVFGDAIRQDCQRNNNVDVFVENIADFAGGYFHTGPGVIAR
jgi:solute carrier family 5 (sodium-coupled monocarboxylate transporter), member 8/12